MGGKRGTTVALALMGAVAVALLVAFWRLARTGDVDVALTNGGAVFMGAAGLALMVLTYMQRD
ncbi:MULTISPECIES: hypothetical protein [unclassified Streptomyces]|uniref:hypothetical protein n=1 Tax=unclassified Streptomyces TaxID=2593676 RepID=UPI001591D56D|nr:MULTISPECIES: hypothetical protein [unclassified Streptomyces]QKW00208.1 hypothetical protein HUT14_10150 [Streptomyces sp. NA02536]